MIVVEHYGFLAATEQKISTCHHVTHVATPENWGCGEDVTDEIF